MRRGRIYPKLTPLPDVVLRRYLGWTLVFVSGIQSHVFADRIVTSNNKFVASSIPPQETQAHRTVIFVAPNGRDTPGSGTQAQPFRTIVAALKNNPQPGTTIQLAPGKYSAESGEIFPLVLSPKTALLGNEKTKGEGILIVGGGNFASSSFANRSVTVLTSDGSHIGGITITNRNPKGYAIWVESSKDVTISNCQLIDSDRDGVFLAGDASARIYGNLFRKNRGSGISAVGSSSGEISDNIFDSTGFGLMIEQRSRVTVTGNRIVNNISGVVINASAPILRHNAIANNSRSGLVVLKSRGNKPNPDLGTAASPGVNLFHRNKKRDINNASGVPIVAAGNDFNPRRSSGPIDTFAVTAPRRVPSPITSMPSQSPGKPAPPADIIIEKKSPAVASKVVVSNRIPIDRGTGSSLGNTEALRFRVIVAVTSRASKDKIRRIVPNAFVSSYRGKPIVQVGAYSDRSQADAKVRQLAQSGFNAIVATYDR